MVIAFRNLAFKHTAWDSPSVTLITLEACLVCEVHEPSKTVC